MSNVMMKTIVRGKHYRRAALMLGAGMILSSLVACGPDESGPSSSLKIDVYGWGPSANGDSFVQGMPDYLSANTIRIKITQPRDGRVLATESFLAGDHKGKLPEISFGENLRVDLEVLDTNLTVVASGSTPVFTFDQDTRRQAFRMMVAPTHKASPVGSLVADRATGQNKLVQSRLDYSGAKLESEERNWLGRIGHGMAVASNGQILIVGGGDALTGLKPATKPAFHHVFSDIQLFDPVTGYFTDLSFDDESRVLQNTGADRLRVGRAFHTVTALGKDRFLVAGGYTLRGGELRAVNSLEIIDLRAPVGMRIQELPNNVQLSEARAFHTATYRSSDGAVVIAGGNGHNGADDVLDSVDVIDATNGRIETIKMKSARVDHSAVLAPDGHAVWLLGGRDKNSILSSTELIKTDDVMGVTVSEAGAKLLTPRFGASAVRLSGSGGNLVAVIGGFSSTAGNAIGDFEVGGFFRDEFVTDSMWNLKTPRGGMQALELPQTNDILLLGGMSNGQVVTTSERLRYRGLEDPLPLAAEVQGGMQQPRHGFGAMQASNGFVFVVGGFSSADNIALDNAEYFNAYDPVKNKGK